MTRRHPILAVLLALVVAGVGGTVASGATYPVLACDAAPNGATNNSWTYSENVAGRFDHGDNCADPTRSEFSGLYTRETFNTPGNVPGGSAAYWTFTPPAGSTVAAITYERHLGTYLDSGWQAESRADNAILESCRVPNLSDHCDLGQAGDYTATFNGLAASQLRVGSRCDPIAPDTTCSDGSTLHSVEATLYAATVTVDDPNAPITSTVGGTLTGGGWLNGTQTVSFSAADGAGTKQLELLRDNTVAANDTRTCDFTRPAPCANPGASTTATWTTVDTTQWPDGTRSVVARATDAAGNITVTSPVTVQVDNTPPTAPSPTADGAWSQAADAAWTWAVPAETARAPIDRLDVEVCGNGSCATSQQGPPPSGPATYTAAVDEGVTTIRVRHRDAAGNLGPWSSAVPVRRDRTAPPVLASSSDEGWRSSTTLPVTWKLPAADGGSPWASAQFELCQPACVTQTLAASAQAGTLTVPGTGEGTIRSRLVDEAGLAGPWSATRTLRIDRDAPGVPVLGAPQPQPDGRYDATVAIQDPGPAPLAGFVGSACPRTGSCAPLAADATATSITTPVLTPGDWQLSVSARDAAGNVGGPATASITVAAPTPTPEPSPTPTATPTLAPGRRPAVLMLRWLRLRARTLRIRVLAPGLDGRLRLRYRAHVAGQTRRRTYQLPLSNNVAAATLHIPKRARARKATITVSFAGNDTFLSARVVRHVRRRP